MFSLQETVHVQSLDHPAVLPFLISLTADMISVVWEVVEVGFYN